jgi:methionine synthase I (cobalamin-dependent)
MNAFLRRLARPASILLDGAMGTALLARGLDLSSERAASWSLSHPDEVLAVHRAHVGAGAELVLTNTFFAPTDAECARALELARASGAALVGASLSAGQPGLAASIAALAGADVLWLETATSLEQALEAVRIARATSGLPVVVTMARFELAGSLGQLAAAGAAAVGLNCSPWPRAAGALAALASAQLRVPLVLKPDAVGLEPEPWARELAGSGAQLLGGCCGATAAHVAALRRAIATPPPAAAR